MKCSDGGSFIFGVDFPLPGKIQTVPRGELYCAVYFMSVMEPLAEAEYVTDNKKAM